MTLWQNTAEGVTPSGTTPTNGNSGGVSGFAWDTTSVGAGSTLTSDSTHPAHGALGYKFVYGSTARTIFLRWTITVGTKTTIFFRASLFFTANPGSNTPIFAGVGTAVLCSRFFVNTSGKITASNSAGTTQITSTNSIPLNTQFRVEGKIIESSTAGLVEFKLFPTADSTTPTETQTSASNINTGANALNQYDFGDSGTAIANITHWMDDLAVSDTGYPGPLTMPLAETGTGTDSFAVSKVTVALSETGHGTDSGAVSAVTATLAETGHGADSGSVHAFATLGESGHGADSAAVSVKATLAEAGHASDAFTSPHVALAETGAGGDSFSSPHRAITDAGHGSDSYAAGVSGAGADTGHGADSFAVTVAMRATQAGHGADSFAAGVALGAAETGTGTDSWQITRQAAPPEDAVTARISGETEITAVLSGEPEITARITGDTYITGRQ